MTLYDPPALAEALCNAITHSELEFLCDLLDNAREGVQEAAKDATYRYEREEGTTADERADFRAAADAYSDTAEKLGDLAAAIREREEQYT